ncbi:MAG: MgtC/SapB family protein [Anaerolineae bacterium]|nr:MgtC/SapB family protein [Anaerolineae bacterium]
MESVFYQSAQFQILLEVILAAFLSALIGVERELADKPAGLRTHVLVGGAAALLVGLSDVAVNHFAIDLGTSVIRADPIRIMEAVVTGVAFLGAGTIIRHSPQKQVEGLTTAASILVAAAIGISVALQQWILAVGVALLVLVILRGLGMIERRLVNKTKVRQQPSTEQ